MSSKVNAENFSSAEAFGAWAWGAIGRSGPAPSVEIAFSALRVDSLDAFALLCSIEDLLEIPVDKVDFGQGTATLSDVFIQVCQLIGERDA